MSTTYLTHLPRKYIRTVAGHELEGSYFLPRDTVEPSEELKSMVFPWVCGDIKELNRKGSARALSNARVEIPAAWDQLALPASIFHEETAAATAPTSSQCQPSEALATSFKLHRRTQQRTSQAAKTGLNTNWIGL